MAVDGIAGYLENLGDHSKGPDHALRELQDKRIIQRIWDRDHRVWKEDSGDIENRLGWLHSPEVMADAVPDITGFVEEIRKEGFTAALLLGMGGSSLAPEMFRRTFGLTSGFLDLRVLDSTHPGAVVEQARDLPPRKTLYLVSTKSGGTVETLSFMKYFYREAVRALGKREAGNHFIAITDPGSSLADRADALGFRRTFLNDATIGGRYSALSYFGLVPAALIGMDLQELLDRALRMARSCREDASGGEGPADGARLGAVTGALAGEGRNKLTLVTSRALSPFGAWVEQLLAESTGKEGRGILPVDGEPLGRPGDYARDRLFVFVRLPGDRGLDGPVRSLEAAGHPVIQIRCRDLYDLGGEIFRWEMATVVAGHLLGINPFDQPNVESSKVLAREMVASFKKEGKMPDVPAAFETPNVRVYGDGVTGDLRSVLADFLGGSGQGEARGRPYVALQAFLQPTRAAREALQAIRAKIQKTCRLATTLGFGPRYLHSTGQLHKGDAGGGLFIQLTADTPVDTPIPDEPGEEGSSLTFGTLLAAQALGDRQALLDSGRRVLWFHLKGGVTPGLEEVLDALP